MRVRLQTARPGLLCPSTHGDATALHANLLVRPGRPDSTPLIALQHLVARLVGFRTVASVHIPELVVAIAAVVTAMSGLVVTLPQMVRVIRTGDAQGVSLPGWVNWCVSYTAWTLYLAGTGQIPLFLGCLGESVVCVTTTLVILRHAKSFRDRAWWSTAAWAATVTFALVANLFGFPAIISALLSCSPIWVYGPSAWKAWRTRDVSGIAPLTWTLALVGALTFVIAGHANPVTVTNGTVSATLSLVILVRLWIGDRSEVKTAPPAIVAEPA